VRTIWNGSVAFGLVSIPVGLAVAQDRKDVSFRTLHRECGTPIKQKRWCPVHEREVGADELVKGWEFAKGQYVVVEESDLEAVALRRSQAIDIVKFVPLDQVDPIWFDRAYYLVPAEAEAQRRPYVLLLRAMQEAAVAAVGSFVLWGKQNLSLIRPLGDTLALELLYYAEDVRSRREIDDLVGDTDVREPELAMARQLVDSLVGDFVPEEFANEHREEVRAMLETKLAGQEVVRPEPVAPAPVIDLMEALKQSIAEASKAKGKDGAAPARKPAAGKKRAGAGRRA
jgi:DNA end-binding protein Ku